MIKHVLFDFDGTLTDSGIGILNTIEYTLKKLDFELPEGFNMRKFVGPPLIVSFKEFCGFDEEKAKEAVRIYRERYSVKGLFENEVYDGILETLQELKNEGRRLYVATTKPTKFATQIAEHFGIMDYFEIISGSGLDGSMDSKELVIQYILDKYDIKNMDEVIMIGDRKFDCIGAGKLGIRTIGVRYGYSDGDELEKAGAVLVAETTSDICDLIRKMD